ncbi:MAG: hypothetical protein M5U01_29345 [Ardenticatenaceae bacterium]|nr:hypothetical protein [Ardenticatenaceae bacterium]HBY99148.1 hypothetical protein [Chloroflexota bacterium]
MRGARVSEHLVTLIAGLLGAAHLAIATALVAFGRRTGAAYPLVRWSVWEFVSVAVGASVALVLLAWHHWHRPHDPGTTLLIVALPVLTSVTLGSGFWTTAALGAPFAPDLITHTWFRAPTVILALFGIAVGIRYRRQRFLSLWFAGLAVLVALNPFLWSLLPRTNWWDARMLVLPLGVFVILHFSQGWPFSLPDGLQWKVLIGLLGAVWAFPPLIRIYRAGEAPAPGLVWLLLMGFLNWTLTTLLVALPLYGWRFGREWDENVADERPYPWLGMLALTFGAATLTAGLLPDLLPAPGAALPWLGDPVVAPATIWLAPLGWAGSLLRIARWLLLPYVGLVALEELSIWTYRRQQARQAADADSSRDTAERRL